MLITWAGKQSAGPVDRARVFNAVVPIWINMRPSTRNDLAPGGGQFPADLMDRIRQKGAIPLIELSPPTDENFITIRNGSLDAYLVGLGQAMGLWMCNGNSTGNNDKSFAKDSRVVLRLGPEVNGDWHNNWEPYLPVNWANAHKRVADKLREGLASVGVPAYMLKFMVHFLQKGANNLDHMNAYYPGNTYVDIFGLSVYDREGDTTPALEDDVDEEIAWFQAKKPGAYVWLAEVGTHFNGSNNVARGAWVQSGYNAIESDPSPVNRRVKVFLYSHYQDSSNKDWRIRGPAYDPSSGTNDSLKARYGHFTTLAKYRSPDIFQH
jgi:hypothetical protein